jgi:hypothetical protein
LILTNCTPPDCTPSVIFASDTEGVLFDAELVVGDSLHAIENVISNRKNSIFFIL